MKNSHPNRSRYPWEASYPVQIRWDDPICVCTAGEYLARAAGKYADRIALRFFDSSISYGELGKLVLQAAASFLELETLSEGGLALLLPNTPWHSICFFGAASAGVRVVQLSPMDSTRELAHKLRDSGARAIVTGAEPDLLGRCRELQAEGLLDKLIVAPENIWGRGDQATLPADALSMQDLITCDPLREPVKVHPEEIAVLQYTGGTTGLPKGASLSHANLIAAAEISALWQTVRDVPKDRGDRVLMYLPLFHAFALTMVNRHLGHGNTVHLCQRFDAEGALNQIERDHITVFHGVPTMFIGMLRDERLEQRKLSSLTYATSGGAPLPMEVGRAFETRTGIRIHPGWGMSEAAAIGCQHIPGGVIRPGSIGMPLPGIELQIVDLENPSRLLPQGESGEIRMRGPNLFHAYWGHEAERSRDFVDGYFCTGDVGHIDREGYVFLTDRKKDMILSSGFNVFPRLIEEAIYEHPDVRECIVIGIADAYRGQAAKAFVVLKQGAKLLSLDDLRNFLSPRLGRHEIPQALEIRDHLPRTSVGKPSKLTLLREENARAAVSDTRYPNE